MARAPIKSKTGDTPPGEQGPNERYGHTAGGETGKGPLYGDEVNNDDWNWYLDHARDHPELDKAGGPASSRKAPMARVPSVSSKLQARGGKATQYPAPKPPKLPPGKQGPYDPEPGGGKLPVPAPPGRNTPRSPMPTPKRPIPPPLSARKKIGVRPGYGSQMS